MNHKEKLIGKLLRGECSSEELLSLFEILENEPDHESPEIMAELAHQLDEKQVLKKETSERIFARVDQQVFGESSEQDSSESIVIPLRRRWAGFYRVAGVAASVILLAGFFWWYQSTAKQTISIETIAGEIREITLPDSSLVTLNGNSRLEYCSNWEEGATRMVFLEGEGYFHVRKSPEGNLRFQVKTRELTVEVLGTSFNVNSRNTSTDVFLDEGKVKVRLDHEPEKEMLMKPGELLSYDSSKPAGAKTVTVESDLHTSWKSGVMIFRDASLEYMIEKISAVYDIHFEVERPEMLRRKFHCALPTKDLALTMTALEKLMGVSISADGDTYIIRENQLIN